MQNDILITDEMFEPATLEEREGFSIMQDPTNFWQDAWKRFKKNKIAMISAIFIILITLMAIFVPVFSPFSYDNQVKGSENIAPFVKFANPLGTDALGRDALVRLMIGARISLAIGILASLMVVLIGVIYGAVSAFFGGWVDNIMMRIVDIIYSVPSMLVVILLSVVLRAPLTHLFETTSYLKGFAGVGPGIFSIFLTYSLLYWVDMARMVRGQILSLKEMEFVNAARALGAKPWRIIIKHLIPNSMGVIIVTATLNIPQAIFNEAFLSFIGLGVSPPLCSLGSLASDALSGIYTYPYRLFWPSLIISLIILSFNLVGDSLRDALDPRMKSKG